MALRTLEEKWVPKVANIVNETVGRGHYVGDRRDLFPLKPKGASLSIYFSMWLEGQKTVLLLQI